MQQFLDFLPILLFVGVYFFSGDIYQATLVLMVATAVQVVATYAFTKRVSGQLWLVFAVSMVFGGLTLALHDKQFLFWKPTIINWLFTALLAGGLLFGKNPVKALLGAQLQLPDPVWRNLAIGWAAAFFVEGVANLVVAYNFTEAFWVGYKLWGGMGLTLLFVAVTVVYLMRGGYLVEPDDAPTSESNTTTPPIAAPAPALPKDGSNDA